jgi:nucleotide-binding universal stress UspA family protein
MDKMKILICTDGSKSAEIAAQELISLRFPTETTCVIFYVVKKHAGQRVQQEVFAPIEAVLTSYFTNIKRKAVEGEMAVQILREIREESYDLIVKSDFGKGWGLLKMHLGSDTRIIVSKVELPLLLARHYTKSIERVLICTGGEETSADTLKVGGRLVSFSKAQVCVLHVMSQLALDVDSLADDLRDTAQTAIQRRTREGLHLAWAVDQVQKAGASAPVIPILRHGLVLDQVIAELREGKYDLLVIGSHHVSGRSRTLDAFLEDVASDLVSETSCSVLII